jgi:hypothetical protein
MQGISGKCEILTRITDGEDEEVDHIIDPSFGQAMIGTIQSVSEKEIKNPRRRRKIGFHMDNWERKIGKDKASED